MDNDFFGGAYKGSRPGKGAPVETKPGFGTMMENSGDRAIDLNEQLIMNRPATFFFRMKGDAMTGAGIHDGDLLIVDRSVKGGSGKIIVGTLEGEMLVRRFQQTFNKAFLIPENSRFHSIEIGDLVRFDCWGVVTCVIHIVEPVLTNYLRTKNEKWVR